MPESNDLRAPYPKCIAIAECDRVDISDRVVVFVNNSAREGRRRGHLENHAAQPLSGREFDPGPPILRSVASIILPQKARSFCPQTVGARLDGLQGKMPLAIAHGGV